GATMRTTSTGNATTTAARFNSDLPVRTRSALIRAEQSLQILRAPLRIQQGQRQEYPRLLRVQFVRCDEAELVIVELDVAADHSRGHARAPHDHHALLHRTSRSVDRAFV